LSSGGSIIRSTPLGYSTNKCWYPWGAAGGLEMLLVGLELVMLMLILLLLMLLTLELPLLLLWLWHRQQRENDRLAVQVVQDSLRGLLDA
ncbi:unnamed protein product, partial [Ectocarpus sp. 8 AP-2014]